MGFLNQKDHIKRESATKTSCRRQLCRKGHSSREARLLAMISFSLIAALFVMALLTSDFNRGQNSNLSAQSNVPATVQKPSNSALQGGPNQYLAGGSDGLNVCEGSDYGASRSNRLRIESPLVRVTLNSSQRTDFTGSGATPPGAGSGTRPSTDEQPSQEDDIPPTDLPSM